MSESDAPLLLPPQLHATPNAGTKRRPQDSDLDDVCDRIANGASLRGTCDALGLDAPSVHRWLDEDEGRRQRYAHARASRAEGLTEQGLTISLAAATGRELPLGENGAKVKIDPAGARVYLEALKFATARMDPKGAPVKKVAFIGAVSAKSDKELDAELEAMGVLTIAEGADDTDDEG